MTTPADQLERAYRRLLRWLPTAYRAEREEEMVGVLLSVAQPRQRRPHPADVLNLSGAIVQVWWRLLWRWTRPRAAILGWRFRSGRAARCGSSASTGPRDGR